GISCNHPCYADACGEEAPPVKEPETAVFIEQEPAGDECDDDLDKKGRDDPLGKSGEQVSQAGTEAAGPDRLPPSEVCDAQKDGGVPQMRVSQRDGDLDHHGHDADE